MNQSRHLHLVVTDDGPHGYSLSSPQVPELVYGRNDLEAFRRSVTDVLAFAEAPDLPRREHRQVRRYDQHGREIIVRMAVDDRQDERKRLAKRVLGLLLESSEQADSLLCSNFETAFGAHLVIITLPGDRLEEVFEQLDPRDGTAMITDFVDDSGFEVRAISRSEINHDPGMRTLDEVGLSLSNTVGDLFAAARKWSDELMLVG